jgi:hypothetical protein
MGAMTTQEMIDEVRASLGNRQDISDARITNWLNWSIHEVCGFHRKRAYTPRRFPSLEGTLIASISPRSGTLASGATASTFVLDDSNQESDDDFYNGWAIKITGYDEASAGTDTPENLVGQFRYVIDYDGGTGTATIISDWDVNPDEYTEYELYTRFVPIGDEVGDPDISIWAIEHVEKADGTVLDRVEWRTLTGEDDTTEGALGEPTMYARYGDNIFLDKYSEDRDILRIYYYAFPTALSTASPDVTTELPALWDEVIVLGAVYRGFGKLMEPDREYNAQQRFEYEVINKLGTRQLEEPSMHKRGIGLRFV